jgi:putative ABC transport system permease protein
VGTFLQDIIFSYRFLKSRFGFAITAVVTLALGIGANTLVFSVMHVLLFKPLPFREADRLVAVYEKDPARGVTFSHGSLRTFLALRTHNTVFSHVTAWYERDTNVGGLNQPLQVTAWQTTADFFDSLGLQPELGRAFRDEEALIGKPMDVVVLGNRFWRRQFNGDPDVLGRTILVDDRPSTILGVMPASEQWLDVDLLMPLPPYVTNMQDRRILFIVGRLESGQTVESARAQLEGIAAAVRPEFRADRSETGVGILPLDRRIVDPESRRIAWLLGGVVLLVLCIAGVNVTNLLLASAVGRRREMAIQNSLGAGRGCLIRRLVTESMMLALLGGALGILLALWGVDILRNFSAGHIPRLDVVGIYGATLLFTAVLALVTGLAAGLVPAIQASRPNIVAALKEATETGFGEPRRHGLRGTLVVVEVALTLALIISAGLLLHSVARISDVDPGFQTAGRLAITVNLPRTRYEPDATVLEFWRSLLMQVRALPGVISATGTSDRWLTGQRIMELDAENQAEARLRVPIAQVRTVTPGYFKTLGIRMLEGRDFNDRDWATLDGTLPGGAPMVALVSRAFAQIQWPGESAIGKRSVRLWAMCAPGAR